MNVEIQYRELCPAYEHIFMQKAMFESYSRNISYDRFEAHEGKSVSDSQTKSDSNISEIIELFKSELNVSTKKNNF